MRAIINTLFLSSGLCLAATADAELNNILAPLSSAELASKEAPLVASIGKQTAVAPVVKAGAALNSDELLLLLEKQLSAHYSVVGDLKLSLSKAWDALQLPDEKFEISVIEYPTAGLSPTFYLRFKVTSGDREVGVFQTLLRAQLIQEAWVVQGKLTRGAALDRSMLTVQKVDTLREKQAPLLATEDPALFDIVQNVPPGRTLTRQEVADRPVIRKGQVVNVVATSGMLSVSMKALALENGGLKDLIKMRNLDSRKEFNAQIINENRVEVHF